MKPNPEKHWPMSSEELEHLIRDPDLSLVELCILIIAQSAEVLGNRLGVLDLNWLTSLSAAAAEAVNDQELRD